MFQLMLRKQLVLVLAKLDLLAQPGLTMVGQQKDHYVRFRQMEELKIASSQ